MTDNTRALLEQALEALTYKGFVCPARERRAAAINAIRAELAKPTTPAWHDAPTCAGVWLSKVKDSDVFTVGAWNLPPELIDRPYWSEMLWYGPIPQEKKEGL